MKSSKILTSIMLIVVLTLFGASVYMATTNTSITELLDISVADLPDATPREDDDSGSGLDPATPGNTCSCSGVADVNQGCAAFGCPEGTKRVCGCISSTDVDGVCQPTFGDCQCVQDSTCDVEDPVVTDPGTGGDDNNGGNDTGSGSSVCTPNETRTGSCGQGNCSASFRYTEVCNSAGSAYVFSECRFDSTCATITTDDPEVTPDETTDNNGTTTGGGTTTSGGVSNTTTNLPETGISDLNIQIFVGICLTVFGTVLLSNSKLFRKHHEE